MPPRGTFLLGYRMALADFIFDRKWAKNALLVQSYNQDAIARDASIFTEADHAFVSTRIGGNVCINPLPQFTRSADIRRRKLTTYGNGIGRYYYEAYQKHYQVIHIRVGVPTFNSMMLFVNSFYSPAAGVLARTGSGPGILYKVGQAAGLVVSVMSWKLLAVRLLFQGATFFARKGSSKFFTLKPAMPMFWSSVQTITNQLAVNMGIVPRLGGEATTFNPDISNMPDNNKALADMQARLHAQSGGIINKSGSIDVFAISTRYQRAARQQMRLIEQSIEEGASRQAIVNKLKKYPMNTLNVGGNNWESYLSLWLDGAKVSGGAGNYSELESNSETLGSVSTLDSLRDSAKEDTGYLNFLKAEFDDGGAFATFRVNYTGSVSESFSNSTGESEIGAKLNSFVSKTKNLSFGLSSLISGTGIDKVLSSARDLVTGAAETIGIGGVVGGVLSTVTGGSFVDIPHTWKGSTAQLPRSNYTISLVSPNNHPYAQLIYIYIPLAMLLSMTLPISTGKQSYNSPFILEYYDQGRSQSRLAMVDSLNITRGQTNLGFNKDNRAMGIEVSLSFVHLDTVVHMPIAQGLGFMDAAAAVVNPLNIVARSNIFDDDNAYTDYLATLSSLGLADQIYSFRKLKLNITKEILKWKDLFSPARLAAFHGNSWPGRQINNLFFYGTVRE